MAKARIPFNIVKLSAMDLPSAIKDLDEAVEKARFGAFGRVAGDKESYGRALLGIVDFCRCPSGLLDDADVRFPKNKLPSSSSGLAARFRWMMHAPENEEVIEALINALRPLWERNPHRGGGKTPIKYAAILPKPNPNHAATVVWEARKDHRKFAYLLMQGYLDKAQRYIAERPADEQASLQEAYREAAIFWIYFKAQIKAARLFHAEWNVFETGAPDAPVRLTIGDASVPLVEAQSIARIATRIAKGETVSDKEKNDLEAFVEDYDLKRLALNHAGALGFSAGETSGDEPVPYEKLANLGAYLDQLDKWVADFVASFSNSKNTRSPTVLQLVHTAAGGNQRLKFGRKPGTVAEQIEAIRADGKREADMVAATARYGMSTLTCLAYAILDMYGSIVALTRPTLVKVWGGGDESRAEKLVATAQREKGDALTNLLAIYRCAITRDQYSTSVVADADTTGFDEGSWLGYDDSKDYDGADFVIENVHAKTRDGLDEVMGRGISLKERLGDIQFEQVARGETGGMKGMADKAIAEARRIQKFRREGTSRVDRMIETDVDRFRKAFGS